jgi:sec-independent protein translocase protein TatA
MGDFAKGIKSFKKGMADDDSDEHKPVVTPVSPVPADPLRTIDHRTNTTADNATESRRVG